MIATTTYSQYSIENYNHGYLTFSETSQNYSQFYNVKLENKLEYSLIDAETYMRHRGLSQIPQIIPGKYKMIHSMGGKSELCPLVNGYFENNGKKINVNLYVYFGLEKSTSHTLIFGRDFTKNI